MAGRTNHALFICGPLRWTSFLDICNLYKFGLSLLKVWIAPLFLIRGIYLGLVWQRGKRLILRHLIGSAPEARCTAEVARGCLQYCHSWSEKTLSWEQLTDKLKTYSAHTHTLFKQVIAHARASRRSDNDKDKQTESSFILSMSKGA